MKKNDFVQIKGLDIKELRAKASAISGEITDLMMDKNMKKLKDLKAIFKKKKDLAQVLTVLRQKELLIELESKIEIDTKKGGSKEVKTQKLKVKSESEGKK